MTHVYWPETNELDTIVKKFQEQQPYAPFDPAVLGFVQDLSKRFIRFREYPEFVALGYWLRKANIICMKGDWDKRKRKHFLKARGTVFHIAPSNVDTIFVYSWILSLLAGNRNIIRLSSKDQPQKMALLSAVLEVFKDPNHRGIANRTILLTYEHNEQQTTYFSNLCNTRVIWGGDETVEAIRQISLPPLANEVVFPNRFSLAAINASLLDRLDKEEYGRLINDFYNDVFWFDQMACSSPKLIVWIGDNQLVKRVQDDFWKNFNLVTREKKYELTPATQMLKFTTSLWLATEDITTRVKGEQLYTRVSIENVPIDVREKHCGRGLFFECEVQHLSEVSSMITDKDQTLTYFGYEKEELFEFASTISTRGIDRIVPIGQALNFNGVWDGQSFLETFTREVVIL
ncbi:acyl-CoA reductase [Robertmurraya sp. GLU-23]